MRYWVGGPVHFILLLAVSVLLATTGPIPAHAAVDCDKVEPDYRPEDVKTPMRFYYPPHPCTGNAVSWPYVAVGVITEATPTAFAEFAKKNRPDTPIEFASPGGNLLAALKLGEIIRNAGYDTSLGEFCASACAYAIMGGVKRYIAQKELNSESDYDNRFIGASGTKLGIHQFYRSDALSEPQKKAFSAIDKSTDQMLMGILLEYTLRMDIDTHLVSVASSIPPWQDIRWLTQEEMIGWNVDNTHRRYTDLVFRAFGRSGSYVEVSNVRGPDASYLRMFCQGNAREPLFAFITDSPYQGLSGAAAAERVRYVLNRMNISFEFGSEKRVGTAFQIQDVQGIGQAKGKIQVSAIIRASALTRQDAERLTRVALQDGGELARSDWTFQDVVKFRIQGDHKLIRLAMKNCVE